MSDLGGDELDAYEQCCVAWVEEIEALLSGFVSEGDGEVYNTIPLHGLAFFFGVEVTTAEGEGVDARLFGAGSPVEVPLISAIAKELTASAKPDEDRFTLRDIEGDDELAVWVGIELWVLELVGFEATVATGEPILHAMAEVIDQGALGQ